MIKFRAKDFARLEQQLGTHAFNMRARDAVDRDLSHAVHFNDMKEFGEKITLLREFIEREAHRFIIDADVVPFGNPKDAMLRAPFPITLLGYTTEVEGRYGGFAEARMVDVVLESDTTDSTLVIPFLEYPDTHKWYPSFYMLAYEFEHTTATVGLDLLWGMDSDDTAAIAQAFDSPAGQSYNMIRDVFALIHCHNVTTEVHPPSNLKKHMARKKGLALREHHTIVLPAGSPSYSRKAQGGTHASPAMHFRRGHYRTLHRGEESERKVYVSPSLVGATKDGTIDSDYEVR